MVSDKSLANLKRGNKKNTGRKAGSGGKTWAALIREYGETIAPDKFTVQVGMDANSTWRQVVVAAAYRNAAAGNAPILKELMQRSEPQPLTHLDLSKLNAEQLERIANGEDPAIVLATSGAGGAGT